MSRELFNSWSDYQRSVDTILAGVRHRLCIYDQDLSLLKLDSKERLSRLQALLQHGRSGCLQIAIRDATHLRQRAPRLMELLATFSHLMSIVETGENLAHLRDSMLIADGERALIRFEQNQARSKLLIDEPAETMPYQKRFEEIWLESNHPIAPTTLGL